MCYPSAPCRLSSSVVRDWTVLIRVCLKFQNHYFILFEPWIPSSKVCEALKSLTGSFWKQWYFETFIQIFSKWSTYVKNVLDTCRECQINLSGVACCSQTVWSKTEPYYVCSTLLKEYSVPLSMCGTCYGMSPSTWNNLPLQGAQYLLKK